MSKNQVVRVAVPPLQQSGSFLPPEVAVPLSGELASDEAPPTNAHKIMQHAARVVALLVAAAGLTDGLQVRPALRQSHALVAASAQRSAPGGASMGLLPSFLTDAQVTSALSNCLRA